MQDLTGFKFELKSDPGSMLIRTVAEKGEQDSEIVFGVDEKRAPRFVVKDADQVLGVWHDSGEPAFALKSVQGYRSVYLGSAPAPTAVLRRLAQNAGARLWSSEPDLVMACRDVAAVVATTPGQRTLALPEPLHHVRSAVTDRNFSYNAEYGQVDLFVR